MDEKDRKRAEGVGQKKKDEEKRARAVEIRDDSMKRLSEKRARAVEIRDDSMKRLSEKRARAVEIRDDSMKRLSEKRKSGREPTCEFSVNGS